MVGVSNILILILGLVLLIKGSSYFIKSAASIAKRFGVSEFIIGLTLVAIGTSIPELASSIAAALKNDSGLIIGNVIGSNIANICLMIGIGATIFTIKTKPDILKRDGYIMLFVAVLFFIFAFNSSISKLEAIIFLIIYFAYVLFLFQMKPRLKGKYNFKEFINYLWKFQYLMTIKGQVTKSMKEKKGKVSKKEKKKLLTLALIKDFLILIIGGAAVVFGARYLIAQAIYFAGIFNLPSTIVGISLVAIGTSLPELVVSITAARKGFGEIALGNIIGSNIANVLLIIGISGLITPLTIIKSTIFYSLPFMIFVSVLLLFFIRSGWKIKRVEGIIFLVLYVIFMTLLLLGILQ